MKFIKLLKSNLQFDKLSLLKDFLLKHLNEESVTRDGIYRSQASDFCDNFVINALKLNKDEIKYLADIVYDKLDNDGLIKEVPNLKENDNDWEEYDV